MIPATQRPSRIPFGAWFFMAIALVLGVQALLYATVLGNTIGPISLFGSGRAGNASRSRDYQVAIVRNDAIARLSGVNAGYYLDLQKKWEATLRDANIDYRVIADRDLTPGMASRFSAAVLPSTQCLGENQRKALSEAVAAGMGMIASGALGTRDEDCNWRGWEYLTEMTGLRSPDAVTPSTPLEVAFRGQRYFSTNLPAGFALGLGPQEVVQGVADQPDAYWSDWKLRPAKGGSPANVAMAVHGMLGRGRVAWFGFSETGAAESGQKELDAFLKESVRWIARQPLAVVGDWPNQKQSAVLIAEDVNDPGSAMSSAILMQNEGAPATFFCNSSARSMPALLKRLESAGEIATSGDSTDPFGEQQAAVQTGRLMRVKRELEMADPSIQIAGFFPPDGSMNQFTAPSLLNAGYRYYFDSAEAHSATPELSESGATSGFLPAKKQQLARIYMTASDDFSVIADYRGPTPWGDDLANGFLQDFQRMAYVGGLYPLVFRSDLLGAPDNLHVLKTILHGIKSQPAWIARGGDLVSWWESRQALRVDVRRLNSHRVRVAITNTGQQDVSDASVYVFLPYRPRKYSVSSALLSLKLPRAELTGDDDALRLDLPTMGRQSSQILVIALDE